MKRPACVVGCCLIFFLGLLFYFKMPEPYSDSSIEGRRISLYGTVDDKYSKNSSSYLIIKNAGIISGTDQKEKHKITVKLKESPGNLAKLPAIGSLIEVSGKGMLFSRARNPGNFDFARYEMIRGIDFEIYDARIIGVRKKAGFPLDEGLCLLRERLSASADAVFREADAAVIKAMLLGDRTGLGEELKNSFRRAGMSHILCISALHVTLLGMGLLRLMKKTGMRKGLSCIISFTLLLLYGRLTGSGVSTVRALITFGLMMAADLLGRTPDLLSSMSAAGIAIMLIRPLNVLDAGFILSFSAVSGIGILEPVVRRFLPKIKGAGSSLGTSLAVTLFMLPEVLYFFFRVPLYSVIINLLVIPLAGILLVSGLTAMTAGCISITVGMIAGMPAGLILSLISFISKLNDSLPFSQVTPGRPGMWQIIVYYLILMTVVIAVERFYPPGLWGRIVYIAAVIFAVFVLTLHIRCPLSITMIDVGQGDCHFIEAGGRTVMIDCGSSDTDQVAKYRVVPYILSRGFDRIDYAVLTHPDADHINGYLELLDMNEDDGLKIGCFIIPDISGTNGELDELTSLAGRRGIKVLKIKTGDTFCTGGLRFCCLNPKKGAVCADMNEISVCLSVELMDSPFAALFTGDVEGEGEKAMMEAMNPGKSRYTLLKCAHHGSANSTPTELLDKIRPLYCFISAGVHNRYGHPHEELLQRLKASGTRIHVTKEEGAVRLDTDGKKIRITHYIDDREADGR